MRFTFTLWVQPGACPSPMGFPRWGPNLISLEQALAPFADRRKIKRESAEILLGFSNDLAQRESAYPANWKDNLSAI